MKKTLLIAGGIAAVLAALACVICLVAGVIALPGEEDTRISEATGVIQAPPPSEGEPTSTPVLLPPTSTPVPPPPPTDTPALPTDTPEPTQPPLPLGTTISFADWDYVVTDASLTGAIGDQVARGAYVAALVQVTNNGTTEREIGGQFFAAQDAQGRLYEMDTDASLEYHQVNDTGSWHLDSIGPSTSATIPVVFDVSPDASGVVLLAAGTREPAVILAENVGGEPLAIPGDSRAVLDWAFAVTEVSTASSIGDVVPRGQYLILILVARNDGQTPRVFGSDLLVVRDATGRTYEMDTDASLGYYQAFDTDAWHLETLGPSLIGTIPVVFDVSPDCTGLSLHATQGDWEPVVVLDAVGGEALHLPGEIHSTGNWEFIVQEVGSATSIGDEVAQGGFLTLVLRVKNLGLSQQEFGSRMLTLKDAQGRTYEMNTDASLEYYQAFGTDAWHLEGIGPSLTGVIPVVFDVAADASGFVLVTQEGNEVPMP
jgi:hypothetical protein